MSKRFSLPTALAVVVLGASGCSGPNPKPADAGNVNVVLSDGGCGCSQACVDDEGFCVLQPAEDGGGFCECEVV